MVVRIPLAAWKEMRKHTIEPAERYLDLTDGDMHAEAERAVDEHLARLKELPEPVKGFAGALLFGGPESTREEMIDNFLHFYRPELAKNPK